MAPPKRKMEITVVDENEIRTLYTMFQNTANHLSQFYTQSVNQQKLAFEAGQKSPILKLHEWMAEKLQEGKMVTVSEILGYLQAKLSGWMPEQEASGSGQNRAAPEMAASSSASQDQDNNPEMEMD